MSFDFIPFQFIVNWVVANFIYKCIVIQGSYTRSLLICAGQCVDSRKLNRQRDELTRNWWCEKEAKVYADAECDSKIKRTGMEWVSLEYKLSPLLEPIAMHCKSFFIRFFVVFPPRYFYTWFFFLIHLLARAPHNFYSVDYAYHTVQYEIVRDSAHLCVSFHNLVRK